MTVLVWVEKRFYGHLCDMPRKPLYLSGFRAMFHVFTDETYKRKFLYQVRGMGLAMAAKA